MAETEHKFEMAPVEAKELLPERQAGWNLFLKATTWGTAAVVALLVVLAVFVA